MFLSKGVGHSGAASASPREAVAGGCLCHWHWTWRAHRWPSSRGPPGFLQRPWASSSVQRLIVREMRVRVTGEATSHPSGRLRCKQQQTPGAGEGVGSWQPVPWRQGCEMPRPWWEAVKQFLRKLRGDLSDAAVPLGCPRPRTAAVPGGKVWRQTRVLWADLATAASDGFQWGLFFLFSAFLFALLRPQHLDVPRPGNFVTAAATRGPYPCATAGTALK